MRTLLLLTLLSSTLVLADPPPYAPANFPHLPPNLQLGPVSAVAINSKNEIIVFHRADPAILVFDPSGKFLRSLGANLFKSSHGLRVNADDNIYATDIVNHTVTKLSPDGKVLFTLGETGKPGLDNAHFDKPTDTAVAPNGDLFVSDGYGNSRIVKFDKTGKFLAAFGKKGTGPGEFDTPHALRFDSKGNLFVADRENRRVQVFSQDGTFLRQFTGLTPYGLFIAPDDTLWLTDGRANRIHKATPEGKILLSFGLPGAKPGDFRLPHAIALSPTDQSLYITEIDGKRIQKLTPAR